MIILDLYFPHLWLKILSVIMVILLGFILNFFRDPIRSIPDGNGIVLSSADGKVVSVKPVTSTFHEKEALLISVFLNVFNVHTNRVPLSGVVDQVNHTPGKFLAAYDHKASDENERSTTVYKTNHGPVVLKQIAGLIARRILNYSTEGREYKTGEKMGFIMFGSRTDILLPVSFKVLVKEGDIVVGGETVIAEVK